MIAENIIALAREDKELYTEISKNGIDADTALTALIREEFWYFAADGMVFFPAWGELRPAEEGIPSFTIPYEKLIGVIIVGTGLPMINTESEIARAYFDGQGRDGFAYAYRYPGMNKVMQAAGRVIRTENDTGMILLLDERFAYGEYRRIFPKEWADIRIVTSENVAQITAEFWANRGYNYANICDTMGLPQKKEGEA